MHVRVKPGEGTPQFRFTAQCHPDAFLYAVERTADELGYVKGRRFGRNRLAFTASPVKSVHGFRAKLRVMTVDHEDGQWCEAIVRHGGWLATNHGGSPRSLRALREFVDVLSHKLQDKDQLLSVSKEPEYVVSLVSQPLYLPDLWRW